MKKKKWLYIVAAVLVALLIFALITGDEQTRAKLPSLLISMGVGIVALLAVVILAWFFSRRNLDMEERFREKAVMVSGSVTKVERMRMAQPRDGVYGVGEDMYLLRAAYEYQGKRYTGARRVYFGKPKYSVGDAITIYVNPDRPVKSKILPEKQESLQA